MSKKIAIYVSDVIGRQFDIVREIASREYEKGSQIYVIVCNGVLSTCPAKNNLGDEVCILCISKRKKGLNVGGMVPYKMHELRLRESSGTGDRNTDSEVADLSSLQALKSYHLEGFPVGMSIFSTIVSRTRNPYPSLKEHKSFVHDLIVMTRRMFYEIRGFIRKNRIEKLYVLNGRRASQAPAVFAALEAGIEYATFESGHSVNDHFVCLENMFIHDVEATKAAIEEYWQAGGEYEDKANIADEFYYARRYGSSEDVPERRFTEHHVSGMLPEGLGSRRRTIVAFTSSEDEIAADPHLENPIYEDQVDGLTRILQDLGSDSETEIIVRVHPNQANVKNPYMDKLYGLEQHENARIVRAESRVDSYALMERADIVLIFNSTMGIESAYYRKPTVLVGRAVYEDLKSCYRAESHQQVMDLLRTRDLQALDIRGAQKFGYYMVKRDIPFKYVPHRCKSSSDGQHSSVAPSKLAFLRHSIKVKGLPSTMYEKSKRMMGKFGFGS
jgi:hypothetical protein